MATLRQVQKQHDSPITVQILVEYQRGGDDPAHDTYTVTGQHAHSMVADDLRKIADELEAIDWSEGAPL